MDRERYMNEKFIIEQRWEKKKWWLLRGGNMFEFHTKTEEKNSLLHFFFSNSTISQ